MARLYPVTKDATSVQPMFIITRQPVAPAGEYRSGTILGMQIAASSDKISHFLKDRENADMMILTHTSEDTSFFRVMLSSPTQLKTFSDTVQTFDDISTALMLAPGFHLDPFLVETYDKQQERLSKFDMSRPEDLHHLLLARDEEALNDVIWNRLQSYGIPLLAEWKDALIELLRQHQQIEPLHIQYFNYHSPFIAAALKISQRGLESIISDAVRSYQLPFALDAMGNTEAFNDINSLNQYINHFAPDLARAVQSNVDVLFDPSRGDTFSQAFYELNAHANRQGLTGMFVPQASTVSAISKTIDKEKFVFVCGEMGVGKTVISASAPYVHARDKGHQGYRAIVLSPNIMLDKWKREIEERVPNADVRIIRSFTDLVDMDRLAKRPDRPTYFVISQTTFKTSYPKEPIRLRQMGTKTLGTEELSDVNERNRDLKEAKLPLLSVNTNGRYMGLVNEDDAFLCPRCHFDWGYKAFGLKLTKPSKSSMKNRCKCGQKMWGALKLPSTSKQRKVSPAWYINKFFPRGYFEYLLVDEAHEFKSGDTEIGRALGQLVNHTTYQLLMTGTLFGGRATDLFYLVARLKPRKLKQENMNYQSHRTFHDRYGVSQTRSVFNRISERTDNRRVDRPGISPSLYPMYLMGSAVFLDLSDLGYALPPYEELPQIIPLNDDLSIAYENAMRQVQWFHDSNANDKDFKRLHPSYTASTLLHQLNSMLDRPYARKKISLFDIRGQETVIYEQDEFDRSYRPNKYLELLNLIEEEKAQGRKVLVYAKDVDTNHPEHGLDLWIKETLEADGISTGLLRATGKDSDGENYPAGPDREKWLKKKQAMHDWDVLVVNPSLVKVGLDMLEYKTIVFYQFGLSSFEYMQASRRSWRIRQDQNIRVVTFAYQHTPQQYYLELLATKIDAALTVQGKMSDEGMRSMADTSSDLNELAKSIMNGDQLSDIETVHDRFRNLNQTYDQLTRSEMMTYDSYSQNPDIESLEKVLRGERLDIIDVAPVEETEEVIIPDIVLLTPEEAKAEAERPRIPVATMPRKRRSDMDLFADLIKVEKKVERKKGGNAIQVDQFALDI